MDHDDDLDPGTDLSARLRGAASDLDAAGAARDAGRAPSLAGRAASPGPRRARVVLAAAAALAVVAAGVVALRSGDDAHEGRVATDRSTEPCGSGDDLYALTVGTDDGIYDVRVGGAGIDTPRRVVDPSWVAIDPAVSPDGRQVVVVRADGDYESAGPRSESLWLVGTDGATARPLTAGTSESSPSWSPDGTTIAYVDREAGTFDPRVRTVPAAGGDPTTLWAGAGESTRFSATAWSPDGAQLALVVTVYDPAAPTADLVVLDADGGRPRTVAALDPDLPLARLRWSTDGAHLLLEGSDGIHRVDLAGGTTTPWVTARVADVSADGQRILHVPIGDADQPTRPLVEGHLDGRKLVADRTLVETGADVGGISQIAVGPCFPDGAPDAPATGPDRPLLGTEWVLGPTRLVLQPVDGGCSSADCPDARFTVDAAGCQASGTVRTTGDQLSLVDLDQQDPPTCDDRLAAWLAEGRDLPFEVGGDVLRLTGPGPYVEVLELGALYVGEPAEPLPVPTTTEPSAATTTSAPVLPTSTSTTTGTVPVTPTGPCADAEALAAQLVDLRAAAPADPSTSPADLVRQTDVVLAATLTGTVAPSTGATGGPSWVVYDLRIDDVVRGDAVASAGDTIRVSVAVDPARVDGDELGATAVAGLPVVVFASRGLDPDPPTDLEADPEGFATACPGQPPIGLVGTAGTWPEVTDLSDLIAQASAA